MFSVPSAAPLWDSWILISREAPEYSSPTLAQHSHPKHPAPAILGGDRGDGGGCNMEGALECPSLYKTPEPQIFRKNPAPRACPTLR